MRLNWSDKYALSSLKPAELRLWVTLYLHSNDVLRSFPSFEKMQDGLDKSQMTLLRALHGLEAIQAVIRVPKELRVGSLEQSLDAKSNVYQLTGVVNINKVLRPVIFLKPETAKTIGAELRRLRHKNPKIYNDAYWACWYQLVTNTKPLPLKNDG